MKDYVAPLVALAVFLFGLVAWRLQLLDKRRFEVAEHALLVHTKVTEALRVLRQRNSWKGFREAWNKELGEGEYDRYNHYRARRRWQYHIPDEKMKSFEEVYKELAPTIELARLYLSLEAATLLMCLSGHFEKVRQASYDLIRIEQPNDSIDPENDEPAPLKIAAVVRWQEVSPPIGRSSKRRLFRFASNAEDCSVSTTTQSLPPFRSSSKGSKLSAGLTRTPIPILVSLEAVGELGPSDLGRSSLVLEKDCVIQRPKSENPSDLEEHGGGPDIPRAALLVCCQPLSKAFKKGEGHQHTRWTDGELAQPTCFTASPTCAVGGGFFFFQRIELRQIKGLDGVDRWNGRVVPTIPIFF